jgi:thiamine transport system permease protein
VDRDVDRDRAAVTEPTTSVTPTARPPRLPRWLQLTLLAVPVGFLGVFFVRPVAAIVATGLRPEGVFDPAAIVEVVTAPSVRAVTWFTVWQAAVSTVLTLAVALPGAYVLARFRFRGRRTIGALVLVPFVLPTVVVGSAFLALLGPRSPVNGLLVAVLGDAAPTLDLRRTVTAILLAHVFFNYAVVVRTVGAAWANLDPRLEDAARALGASRWRAVREVSLPLVRPAIAASAAIVFLFTFTSFGVVLLLGGPGVATLEVEIHRATTQLLDLRLASVLALLQLTAVVAALAVYGRLQRRTVARAPRASEEVLRRPRTRGERRFLGANLAVIVVLLAAPPAVLVERSLATGDGYGLGHYTGLASQARGTVLAVAPLEAIRNSVTIATVAALIALVVGTCTAIAVTGRRGRLTRVVDRALMLPLGTSAVTVGFGFLLALGRLRGHPVVVPIAQALIAIPFVVRSLVPAIEAIEPRLRDAAATLGATRGRVWREIDLPIVGRTVLVAAGFAFAIAVGEFGATVFVARAELPTVPVAIFRSLGRPGAANFGQAMALSSLLMAVTASVLVLIDRVRVGAIGRF